MYHFVVVCVSQPCARPRCVWGGPGILEYHSSYDFRVQRDLWHCHYERQTVCCYHHSEGTE